MFGSSQSNHGESNIDNKEGARDVNNIWVPEVICWLSVPKKVAGITQMSSDNCINGFKIAKGKLNFALLPALHENAESFTCSSLQK